MQVQRVRKTDLARKTRQVIRTVQRGEAAVISSHGEEEAVILDILDYRILRAVLRFYGQPRGKRRGEGLSEQELARHQDLQAQWNLVMAHYLGGSISLARAAELVRLSPFELRSRFQRLEVPTRVGPRDMAELEADLEAARKGTAEPRG